MHAEVALPGIRTRVIPRDLAVVLERLAADGLLHDGLELAPGLDLGPAGDLAVDVDLTLELELHDDGGVIPVVGPARRPVTFNRDDAEFLGKVVHELRGGVAGIVLRSGTLSENLDQVPEDQLRVELGRLAEQGERLRTLMERLLDLSRVTGRGLDRRPVQLAAVVRDVLAAEGWTQAGDTVIELAVAEDLEIVTDAVSLDQILGNLLRNAHLHGGSRIAVAAEGRDDMVVLTIADDGPGLDEAQQATLFQPYARRDEAVPGWGLGLVIVAELARALDGRVAYEPNQPRGARFVVTLPTRRAAD